MVYPRIKARIGMIKHLIAPIAQYAFELSLEFHGLQVGYRCVAQCVPISARDFGWFLLKRPITNDLPACFWHSRPTALWNLPPRACECRTKRNKCKLYRRRLQSTRCRKQH